MPPTPLYFTSYYRQIYNRYKHGRRRHRQLNSTFPAINPSATLPTHSQQLIIRRVTVYSSVFSNFFSPHRTIVLIKCCGSLCPRIALLDTCSSNSFNKKYSGSFILFFFETTKNHRQQYINKCSNTTIIKRSYTTNYRLLLLLLLNVPVKNQKSATELQIIMFSYHILSTAAASVHSLERIRSPIALGTTVHLALTVMPAWPNSRWTEVAGHSSVQQPFWDSPIVQTLTRCQKLLDVKCCQNRHV